MKVFVNDQQRQQYREHNAIEFEGLLTEERCANWCALLQKQLSNRESLPYGRCLWRSDEALQRILRTRHLGDIAFELTKTIPLRLGVDSFLVGSTASKGPAAASLEELSCYSGLVCGLLIRLAGDPMETEGSVIPKEVGSGVYLSPQAVVDHRALLSQTGGAFLLITYVSTTARYVHREKDPHRHADKRDGYASGDRLREAEHPILYR
jgi:hypothetical protein